MSTWNVARTLAWAGLVVNLGLCASGCGDIRYPKYTPDNGDTAFNLAQLLTAVQATDADGNTAPLFSTFLESASSASLAATLEDSAPHTVFAPTNAAFAMLPPGVPSSSELGNVLRL